MTKPEIQAAFEKRATAAANEAAMPILRDMYPMRSRGQMANEFRHFYLAGSSEMLELMWPLKEGLEHICSPELKECCKAAWINNDLENHYHEIAAQLLANLRTALEGSK